MTDLAPPFDAAAFRAALATTAVGRPLHCHARIPSTMDAAREAAAAGATHGTLILAESQAAGRGRRGRSFHSPAGGNLYVTFVLRPRPGREATLPIAVPLAVCEAVRAVGVDALVKWPNDIWAGGRKLCGMLIDAESEGSGLVAFAGIGVNVNADPRGGEGLADIATSVALELGRPVSREALLAGICNRLEAALALAPDVLAAAYARLSLVLGRQVVVHEAAGETYEALALRVAPDGALVVRCADGEEAEVHAGEVSIRPAAEV